MRLRPLTEAECYARCYGGMRSEQVSLLHPAARPVEQNEALDERPLPGSELSPEAEAA